MLTADQLKPYHPQEYFAFVEDDDSIDPSVFEVPEDQWWAPILRERRQLDLDTPARLVWLDCISANYFSSIPWRDEICQVGNPAQSERRRRFIQEMDPTQFVIAPLFLSTEELQKDFDESDWHRVTIGLDGGFPVLVSPDYDFGIEGAPPDVQFLRYEKECSEPERVSLRRVFNLNFLPDAHIEEDAEPLRGNHRPQKPQPTPKVRHAGYGKGYARR